MPFIPGSNILQVNFLQTLFGESVQNVQYWRHAGGIDQTAANALGTFLVAWWDVELSANLSSDLTLVGLRMMDLTSDNAPVYDFTDGTPTSGTVVSPSLPNNVAFCMSLRTGNRGRSGRGRQYLAGLGESFVQNFTITQGVADAYVAAYMELVNFPLSGWTWGVASRYSNNQPRTQILFQPITSVIYTDLRVDTMRKRLPGA
jgi:hypothetical protein